MPKTSVYKIAPELVPAALWGKTASRMLKRKKAWKTIRDATLTACGHRCSVCNRRGKLLFCHEQWKYQPARARVTLTGFTMVCERCNTVIHAGRAIQTGFEEDVVKYLRETNKIGTIEAVTILWKAYAEWDSLNEIEEWTMVIPRKLAKLYPELAALPDYEPPSGLW